MVAREDPGLPPVALPQRLALREGAQGAGSRAQTDPAYSGAVPGMRDELHAVESGATETTGLLMDDITTLRVLMRLHAELHEWIASEYAKRQRSQNTIDELKRRCGVTTPEKS